MTGSTGDDLTRLIKDRLEESGRTKHLLAMVGTQSVARAAEILLEAMRAGHKLLLFGNGGSAADAEHIAAEFVGRYAQDRPPLPAIALTTDPSAVTAIANDYGFEEIFARQTRALGLPGDVAMGISTSGRSQNVRRGLMAARDHGLRTIALLGGDGGEVAELVDASIVVPSQVTARIQESHITIGHILAEVMDWQLFGIARPAAAREGSRKIVDQQELVKVRQCLAQNGQRVVWTNGCFDLLHVGHIRGLEGARSYGDVLIVGLNSDRSVTQLKGPGRPIVPEAERAEILAALACVDFVVVFDDLTPEAVLAEVRPDVFCKGADYLANGKALPERAVVESYGGRVQFVPYVEGHSTTALAQRLAR
jgi:D-sedoheptulose 7-phosphate isomerase